MPCCDALRANALRCLQKLVKLQVIVAQCAWNWSPTMQILLHERPHNLLLKSLLRIYQVVRNAEMLGHATGVVYVIDRAAASLHAFRHAFPTCQSALVPK